MDEFANIVVGNLLGLVEGELLVLDSLLNGESGPFAIFEVQVCRMCAERFGVDGGEVDSALELFGKGFESLS